MKWTEAVESKPKRFSGVSVFWSVLKTCRYPDSEFVDCPPRVDRFLVRSDETKYQRKRCLMQHSMIPHQFHFVRDLAGCQVVQLAIQMIAMPGDITCETTSRDLVNSTLMYDRFESRELVLNPSVRNSGLNRNEPPNMNRTFTF
jgi:hypothetical protein